jgi:hypothetical protein
MELSWPRSISPYKTNTHPVRERASSTVSRSMLRWTIALGTPRYERKIKQICSICYPTLSSSRPRRTDWYRRQADGRSVEISVSDTGVGIAAEDQPKVFEEFRQVGPTMPTR